MADRHPSDFPEIDSSEFHDLMHPPFTRHCRALPGGWRRHVALAWEHRWSEPLRAVSLCPFGFHRPVTCRAYGERRELVDEFQMCRDCTSRLGP